MFGEANKEDDIGFAWSVAFHPDGNTIAGSGWAGAIDLWDANTGEHIRTLAGHTGSVRSVAFHPDGNTLASGSMDNTLRLWNPNTGENLKMLKGHTAGVWTVSFSPDGNTLASAGGASTIKLWNTNTGELLKTLEGHSTIGIAFSPDGNTIASGDEDGTIHLWHVDTAAPIPIPDEPIRTTVRTTVNVSKPSSIVAPGKTFTLDATLENTGGISAAATLQFYGPVKVERTRVQATSRRITDFRLHR